MEMKRVYGDQTPTEALTESLKLFAGIGNMASIVGLKKEQEKKKKPIWLKSNEQKGEW